jgi:hypothetical protein
MGEKWSDEFALIGASFKRRIAVAYDDTAQANRGTAASSLRV